MAKKKKAVAKKKVAANKKAATRKKVAPKKKVTARKKVSHKRPKRKVRISDRDLTTGLRNPRLDGIAKDDVNVGDDVARYQDGLDIPPN